MKAAPLVADVHGNIKRLKEIMFADFCTDFYPKRKRDAESTYRKKLTPKISAIFT
jgi:hypothetical protein